MNRPIDRKRQVVPAPELTWMEWVVYIAACLFLIAVCSIDFESLLYP